MMMRMTVMLKLKMTLIATVTLMVISMLVFPKIFLLPDFRNAPDPDDIFALRWGKSFYMEELPTLQKKNLGVSI